MRYSTSDLSKILGVSGNTIRRYDEMGYLTGKRDEENGYRQFFAEDVERLMYVTRYRREEFSHDEVAALLKSGPEDIRGVLSEKREAIQKQIAKLTAIDHLLKDDLTLMNRAKDNLNRMIRRDCQPVHFVRYMKKGELCITPAKAKAIRRLMDTCPEFYYMYLFEKDDILKGEPLCSCGVAANTLMTGKYGFEPDEETEHYAQRPCVLRFVRTGTDAEIMDLKHPAETWYELFGPVLDYMKKEGLELKGDVMALRIGSFYEEGRRRQYILFHFPV